MDAAYSLGLPIACDEGQIKLFLLIKQNIEDCHSSLHVHFQRFRHKIRYIYLHYALFECRGMPFTGILICIFIFIVKCTVHM